MPVDWLPIPRWENLEAGSSGIQLSTGQGIDEEWADVIEKFGDDFVGALFVGSGGAWAEWVDIHVHHKTTCSDAERWSKK